jgi:hypothetical protein
MMAFQCLIEALRLRSSYGPYTQSRLESVSDLVSRALIQVCQFELQTLSAHIKGLRTSVMDPLFVRSNSNGTEELNHFMRFARDFGLDHLPLCQNAQNLFPNLNELLSDRALKRRQFWSKVVRGLCTTVGAVLTFVGSMALFASCAALGQNHRLSSATLYACMGAAAVVLATGLALMFIRGPLPIEGALARRFQSLRDTAQNTIFTKADFHGRIAPPA